MLTVSLLAYTTLALGAVAPQRVLGAIAPQRRQSGNTSSLSSVVSSTTSSSEMTVSAIPAASPTPVPGTPQGGIGLDKTPTYKPMSDFDFQSLNLGLHQELIELDLFHFGLAQFSMEDFQNAGLNADDKFLIEFMADQEVGHATLLSNILYPNVTQQCTYSYPNFTNVMDFIDFCQRLTRFGESGTFGFLAHLDAQDAGSLLMDAIATEARQQMVFRQMEGAFPMPFWFIPSITQSMQWTLLAPYVQSCPEGNPQIEWTNFPALSISNNPYIPDLGESPAISNNNSQITYPGRVLNLTWESPGMQVGPNSSFMTKSLAGEPKYVAWISQLNTTYTMLENVNGTTGTTTQPGGMVYEKTIMQGGDTSTPLLNGTIYCLITDEALYVTPYNLSQIEPHIVAGPALYQVG